MFKELNNFLQFLFGFVSTGDVVKSDLYLIFTVEFSPRLAKRHDTVSSTLGLLHNEKPNTN
jgi:hypothetical protein